VKGSSSPAGRPGGLPVAAHGVAVTEVLEVVEDVTRYAIFRNPPAKRGGAPYVVVGPTRSGRLLTVPIDETYEDGLWRPRTAYDTGRQQAVAYHGRPHGRVETV
jgi:hypothetical protein